jgi:hypothetical protein
MGYNFIDLHIENDGKCLLSEELSNVSLLLLKKRVDCHTTLSLSAVCAPITRKVLAHP